MNARFTRDMEAAALFQHRAALSQGLDDAGVCGLRHGFAGQGTRRPRASGVG